MAGIEIERKWLVETAPADALATPAEPIEQGYLTIGTDGGETRLRRRGDTAFLTVKSGTGMTRHEHETELTIEQFETLWPATEGARLVKHRHIIRGEGGHQIELDIFAGALEGLIVAEVEFDVMNLLRRAGAAKITGRQQQRLVRIRTEVLRLGICG